MRPLRPILVSNEAGILGGGEESLLLLVEGLSTREDVEPVLAVPAEGEVAARARRLGVEVLTWPLPSPRRRPWAWPWAIRTIRRGLEKGADLVHANGTRAMLMAGRTASKMGIPVVWHVRVQGSDILDRFLERRADRVVVPAAAVARRFRAALVIPNPVRLPDPGGLDLQRRRARETLGAGEEETLILCAGLLSRIKGQDTVVEAFGRLPEAVPARLFLAGEADPVGPGFAEGLEEQVRRLDLEDRVVFLGWRDDLGEMLPGFDLLVHAPRIEGFGRVYAEAMAGGLPVLAAPVGGLVEIHRQTGWGRLAPSREPGDLARAMHELIEDPDEREAMRRSGPGRAREHYALEAHTEAVVRLYGEIAGPGS